MFADKAVKEESNETDAAIKKAIWQLQPTQSRDRLLHDQSSQYLSLTIQEKILLGVAQLHQEVAPTFPWLTAAYPLEAVRYRQA